MNEERSLWRIVFSPSTPTATWKKNRIDWKERLPDKYKSQAPVRKPAGIGQLRLYMEGKAWPRPDGLGIGIGGPAGPGRTRAGRA